MKSKSPLVATVACDLFDGLVARGAPKELVKPMRVIDDDQTLLNDVLQAAWAHEADWLSLLRRVMQRGLTQAQAVEYVSGLAAAAHRQVMVEQVSAAGGFADTLVAVDTESVWKKADQADSKLRLVGEACEVDEVKTYEEDADSAVLARVGFEKQQVKPALVLTACDDVKDQASELRLVCADSQWPRGKSLSGQGGRMRDTMGGDV